MRFGISLTAALGKEDVLPGAGEKPVEELYIDLVRRTRGIAERLELSVVELISFPPFDAEILQPKSEEIRNLLEHFEVYFHLPAWEINPVALHKEIRAAALREQKRLVDFAAAINAKHLCMHPASFGAMRWAYGWFLGDIKSAAIEAINEISQYARKQQLSLNIENLPYKSIFFTQPQDFRGYLSNEVGMVLDTAHAFTAGVDPVEFLQVYSERVKEVHVVDGFNQHEDTHSPLGEGAIDFENFFSELARTGFDGPAVIEMMSEEDALRSIAHLRSIGLMKDAQL